ncbi:MAG: hypothetical protein PHO37_00090 [Kiritimatiellae bacterium]|nr:hypothetical protein [Kiritimatiellia bacterium]
MDVSQTLKQMMRTFLDLALIVFVTPPAFVFTYFFPLFFSGNNFSVLARDMVKLSFYVSWVSAPLLVAAVLALKLMIRRKLRWFSVLLASYAAGFLWLILWNWVIEDLFTFWRSLIPLSVCCLFSMVYVMAKALYQDDKMNFSEYPDADLLNPKER